MTEEKEYRTVAVKLTDAEIETLRKRMGCFGAGTAGGIIIRQWLKEQEAKDAKAD